MLDTLARGACVLSLLIAVPHEATHYALARLAGVETDDAQIAVEVSGGRAVCAVAPIESPPRRVVVGLGPTLVGGLLLALWLASGVAVDGWRALAALGLALYAIPSPGDVAAAAGRHTQQESKK